MVQSAQGDAVFNVEVEDTEVVLSFEEDCNLTLYFKKPSMTTCFLSWAVTTVPVGTGEEVAAACGAQVDEVSEEDDDQDTLYLKNIPPGPNVPLLIGCSVSLMGKTFRVPREALMGIISGSSV